MEEGKEATKKVIKTDKDTINIDKDPAPSTQIDPGYKRYLKRGIEHRIKSIQEEQQKKDQVEMSLTRKVLNYFKSLGKTSKPISHEQPKGRAKY